MTKAIVLLGYRDAGKDSVCKELAKVLPSVHNAKFGAFNKMVTASLLDVPEHWLEDKEWREQDYVHGVTPLDILNAFFVFSNNSEKFQQKIDRSCLHVTKHFDWVVFTDVRRDRELGKVLQHSDFSGVDIYYLTREGLKPSEGDEDIDAIVEKYALTGVLEGSVEVNTLSILDDIGTLNAPVKPTLHLCSQGVGDFFSYYPSYEPLNLLKNKVLKFMREASIHTLEFKHIFASAINGVDLATVDLAPISESSHMFYHPNQHSVLVPGLRKIAKLRLYLKKSEPKPMFAEDFKPEEILYL